MNIEIKAFLAYYKANPTNYTLNEIREHSKLIYMHLVANGVKKIGKSAYICDTFTTTVTIPKENKAEIVAFIKHMEDTFFVLGNFNSLPTLSSISKKSFENKTRGAVEVKIPIGYEAQYKNILNSFISTL